MQRRLDHTEFADLLNRIADAWAARDADEAAACFTDGAVYMEPPDRQLFLGQKQIRDYFTPLRPGTYLDLHRVWFDEASQTGAAEFSFGVHGSDTADHGVVIVGLANGLVSFWREYHVKGPAPFERFIDVDDKEWTWHAGNYP